jgi:hypothetical protein
MLILTRLTPESSYAANVLPALLVQALGMGLIFAPAMNGATLGVDPSEAGVASAMVNTSQQVGGSIGTALLSTLANTASASFVAGRQPNPAVLAQAAVHGYTTAFWWAFGIFLVGAVVVRITLPAGRPAQGAVGEPVLAH